MRVSTNLRVRTWLTEGLNAELPALPAEDYAPPPLPPKTPDLPKSSSAELVTINEAAAAAVAVRRRTRSGPQPLPLSTSYHGNLNRSADAPPRLHTTKNLYASPRQPHRRAHSVQHSMRDPRLIPDFTLPGRSASRQSLKESISAPSPVLPDKLMPSSYHGPYASTRAAPSPPKQPPAVRRPIGSHRPAPPPPDLVTAFSHQRPLPPLPDVPASPVAAISPVSPLPRSVTAPALVHAPTRTSVAVKPAPVKRRISILKNPLKDEKGGAVEPPSPGSLAKQQALAWRKAVREEAIAALHEAETWDWPVPPNVPALERSMSISTCSASPTKSLAELASDCSGLMIELEERAMERNVSSTFSSDMGPLTPDEHDERDPFDALGTKQPAMVVTAPDDGSSPRSVASYGVPF